MVDTFNGANGDDLYDVFNGVSAFSYGGAGEFNSPILEGHGAIGNGFVDSAASAVFVGNALGSGSAGANATYTDSLPTQFVPNVGATLIGRKPPGATPERGAIVDPAGIAVDRANSKLYVGDDVAGPDPGRSAVDAISRFDIASGNVEEFLMTSNGELAGLRGIAVDPSGDYVYAAAAGQNVVYKLSPSLTILGRFGFPGPNTNPDEGKGSFADVWDVDVDAGHSVWVTDKSSDLVQFFWFPFGPD